MTDKLVLMPASLTAENGAKYALSGEFFETITYPCSECGGDTDKEFEGDETDCHCCCNTGEISEPVNVAWTTIKDIHKKSVELFKSNQEQMFLAYLKQIQEELVFGYEAGCALKQLIDWLESE